MKLHHTEYKKNYRNYILSTITEDGEGENLNNDNDKIEYIFNKFYEEFDYEIKKSGKFKAMSMWLSGLPLSIEHYYDDIVKLAIEMGSIDENPSDKLRNKVEQNYFDFMAAIVLSFKRA
jgi:hypothetical protein